MFDQIPGDVFYLARSSCFLLETNLRRKWDSLVRTSFEIWKRGKQRWEKTVVNLFETGSSPGSSSESVSSGIQEQGIEEWNTERREKRRGMKPSCEECPKRLVLFCQNEKTWVWFIEQSQCCKTLLFSFSFFFLSFPSPFFPHCALYLPPPFLPFLKYVSHLSCKCESFCERTFLGDSLLFFIPSRFIIKILLHTFQCSLFTSSFLGLVGENKSRLRFLAWFDSSWEYQNL